MRLFTFADSLIHTITQFSSIGADIGGVSRGQSEHQLSYLQLAPNGKLGRHAATTGQLFLVISGEGWVSGSDNVKRPIHQGIAAYWELGEEHETTTATGLAALILESDTLEPANTLRELPPDQE